MVPIVVDLGRAKKKDLQALSEGTGPLVKEIQQALEELQAGLPEQSRGKKLAPVVVRYTKKEKKAGLGWMFGI